jgi:hypothetical protein
VSSGTSYAPARPLSEPPGYQPEQFRPDQSRSGESRSGESRPAADRSTFEPRAPGMPHAVPQAGRPPFGPSAGSGGTAEPALGLGARLAELQAVSGAFATVPVEATGDASGEKWQEPDTRPARGMWEPKVPVTPVDEADDGAEPADNPGYHTEAGSYRDTGDPSGYDAPSAGYGGGAAGYEAGYGADAATGYGSDAPAGYGDDAPAGYGAGGAAGYGGDAAGYGAGSAGGYGTDRPAEPAYRPERTIEDLPPLEPITVEPSPAFALRGATDPSIDLSAYEPANSTEEDLLAAVRNANTDGFLSTLLLAKVLVPGYTTQPALWPVEEINEGRYLVAFTSPERQAERPADSDGTRGESSPGPTVIVRFTNLIAAWPDDDLGFAVNPGTPIGATLSGDEVRTLAVWAAEVGLIEGAGQEPAPTEPAPAPEPAPRPAPRPAAGPPGQPLLMQRTVAAAQVPLYLDRGYDRVSGFVHRSSEVDHLRSPSELYRALGLVYPGSQFHPDDPEVYVLRWPAHCPSLYRIPFGGQNEAGMHAMQGWVIERAPFRGNGFAPSETGDVVAEFKVDSTRVPHGTQLWRLTRAGTETLVALFDADAPRWRRVGPDSATDPPDSAGGGLGNDA